MKMKCTAIIICLLSWLSAASQELMDEIEFPTIVEQTSVIFKKGSWKPFSGNLLIEDKELRLKSKAKIVNGFETLSETYDQNNTLVRLIKNGHDVEVDRNTKTAFSENDTFSNEADVKQKTLTMSYSQDSKTKKKIKYNGVVAYETTKLYYKNGVIVRVEYFFDEAFKKIKESYKVFHTEFGNFELPGEAKNYDGDYKVWNEKGKLIESGKYKAGEKIK